MCLAKESSWAHKRTRKSAWVSTNSSPLGKNYLQGYASNVMQRQHIFKNHTSGWLPGLRSQGKSTPSSWFPAGKTKEQIWIPSPLTTSPAESTVLVPGTAQRLVTNSMGSLTIKKMAPAFVQNRSMQKLCCEQKRFRLTPTESTTLWVYKVVAGRPHPSLQRLYTSNCWKHYQQKYKFSMREFVVILHTLQILPFPIPNAMCLGLPKLGYSKTKEKRKGTDFSKVCLTVPFRRHYRVPGTYPAGVMNTKGGEMEL